MGAPAAVADVISSLGHLALSCPVVLLLLLTVNVAACLIRILSLDDRLTSCSYNDLVIRKQWWKVLSAPLCHSSLMHLLMVSSSLWSIREAEVVYGSLYVLKYTLVLLLSQRAVCLGAVHWVVTRHRSAARRYAPQLATLQSQGATSLVFAWLGFLSFRRPSRITSLLPFGLVPVSFAYLPVLLLLAFQLAMPRSPLTTLDCSLGLITGYALSLGVLEVLGGASGSEDGGGGYWTACFLLDMLLLGLHAVYSSSTGSSNSRSSGSNGISDEFLPLLHTRDDYPDLEQGSEARAVIVTLAALQVEVEVVNGGDGREEEEDEEDQQQLRGGRGVLAEGDDDLESAWRQLRAPVY